ncbi:MAG: 3'(2'),5'-bisphosphate nucleotidase CysQ [Pseudomonadota bacterium]
MTDADLILNAAREAGAIGLKYFRKDPEVWIKGKDSPVSEADLAIDTFLKDALLSARPDYGWLSEESEDDEARLSADRVFVVDPIDGTRGFLQGTENWMVSVAIVENGRPTMGALFGPVMERMYFAETGGGASMNDDPIRARAHADLGGGGPFAMAKPLATAMSRQQGTQIDRADHIHSLAYRLARVASAEMSGVVVKPTAHDWDLAAVDVILSEAGAGLVTLSGALPAYNRSSPKHQWLIAAGENLITPLRNATIGAIEEAE